MNRAIAILVGVCLAFSVRGAPPENADPALGSFYRSLKRPGSSISCCSTADCRPVAVRWDHGKLLAFIGDTFPNNPNPGWHEVPDNVVIRGVANQAGQPVACWYDGEIACFIDGGAS